MKARSRLAWLMVGLLAVLLLAFYGMLASGPVVPAYQGKTLYEWAAQLQAAQQNWSNPNRWQAVESAQKAIRAMGTNALPFVMADVTGRLGPRDRVINWLAPRVAFLKLKPVNVADRWQRGIAELEAMGAIAKPCLPQLAALARTSTGYSEAALMAVGPDALPWFTKLLATSKFPQTGNLIGAFANSVFANRISPEEGAVALPDLVRVFQSADSHGRWYAASAMGAVHQQPGLCVPLLISGLNDPTPSFRQTCVEALGRFGEAASAHAQLLAQAFDSADANTRRAICGALAGFHSAGTIAVPVLIRGVQDQDENVRVWAAIGLGQLGILPGQSIPALSQALADRSPTVRVMAAQSLGKFGPSATNAIPLLDRACSDANESVRSTATNALNNIRR
jgi:hypothetical protein